MKPTTSNVPDAADSRDHLRGMAPSYIAVIVVEVVTLLALWWFQRAFSA